MAAGKAGQTRAADRPSDPRNERWDDVRGPRAADPEPAKVREWVVGIITHETVKGAVR